MLDGCGRDLNHINLCFPEPRQQAQAQSRYALMQCSHSMNWISATPDTNNKTLSNCCIEEQTNFYPVFESKV